MKANESKKILPAPPVLPESFRPFSADGLCEDFEDVYGAHSENEKSENLTAASGNIDKTLFEGLSLSAADFKLVHFTDVIFRRCKLTDVILTNCGFYRVLFEDCTFYNVSFNKCTVYDTLIKACEGKYVAFSESKLKTFCISESKLPDGYFFGCFIKNVSFENVDFTNLEADGMGFSGVDFSDCVLDGLRTQLPVFKGATVNAKTALALIAAQGIKIV